MFETISAQALAAGTTILAAIIAGAIALISLIISKEQKVSEFRQDWINALRNDLSDFVAAAMSVHTQNQIFSLVRTDSEMSVEDAFGKISLRIHDAYCAYHKVVLRLNPDEHKALRQKIIEIERTLSKKGGELSAIDFGILCAEFDSEAQRVLKREWKRVKSGEMTYKITKYAFLMVLVLGLSGAGILYWLGT